MDQNRSSPECLRRAIACLGQAHVLLERRQSDEESGPASEASDRLRAAQRSLEDALALAQADDEAAELRAVLRQHERALADQSEAERACARERQEVAALRASIRQAERVGAGARHEERAACEVSGEEGARLLQAQCEALRQAIGKLQSESEGLSELLASRRATVKAVGAEAAELELEHSGAVVDAWHAARVLGGHPDQEHFRKTKEEERAAADARLAEARSVCSRDRARLEEERLAREASFRADAAALEADARSLRQLLADERAMAESILGRQRESHGQLIRAEEAKVVAELGRLGERQQSLLAALRKGAADSEIQLRDSAKGSERLLDAHLRQAKLSYMSDLQEEKAGLERTVQVEQKAVAGARREREEMERKVARLKESYRAHVLSSKSYVQGLDPRRREQLAELWVKG